MIQTEEFITKLKEYNVIYLCADTHNFQIGFLNNSIPMIIGGTGGASLDELCYNDKNKKIQLMVQILIIIIMLRNMDI